MAFLLGHRDLKGTAIYGTVQVDHQRKVAETLSPILPVAVARKAGSDPFLEVGKHQQEGGETKRELIALNSGTTIEDYPDDTPFPSRLTLGWAVLFTVCELHRPPEAAVSADVNVRAEMSLRRSRPENRLIC